jgi:hypothetical protein
MPKALMSPVFPSGPLNLNNDGTEINYRKSHAGIHADYWANADGEEMERLFTTGTMKPILFHDIPVDKIVTYVNPVCVEKQNDDGSLKFRTRLTIGGDRIAYPFDTTAVTAEMESLKILLNCMISEHANWSTIDLTDFYLGTALSHPEYIRIPLRLIPENVIAFYNLQPFISGNALFCSVHKTHYGLPQAGSAMRGSPAARFCCRRARVDILRCLTGPKPVIMWQTPSSGSRNARPIKSDPLLLGSGRAFDGG